MEHSEVVKELIKKTIIQDAGNIRFWAHKQGECFSNKDWDGVRKASNLIDTLEIHIEELLKAL